MAEGARELSMVFFYKDIKPIHEGSTLLRGPLNLESPLKGPTSKHHHIVGGRGGVRVSTYEFWGDKNIQSIADLLWQLL